MTVATRKCMTWLCKGRTTGRQLYCDGCRTERKRLRRRARGTGLEHVGEIIPRVMARIEGRKTTEALRDARFCDCGRTAARGDVRCRRCRREVDLIYGEEAVT